MASNFAEAFFNSRNAAQDRLRQQEADAMQRQQFDVQMQGAQQKQQASQQQALFGLAKGYKDYLQKNPQGGAQYYENFLRPSLAGLGLGDAGPYNEQEAVQLADQVLSAYGGQATSGQVQSTRVGADGYYYTVDRSGRWTNSGVKADPNTQIIEGEGGFFNVDKRGNRATPVTMGGTLPTEDGGQIQFQEVRGPDGQIYRVEAGNQEAMGVGAAEAALGGPATSVRMPGQDLTPAQYAQGPQQLRPAAKAPTIPAGYRQNPDGTMAAIPGGPADVARQAREDAAAARKAAEDVKASQKAQESKTRQAESANTAQNLVNAIDTLTGSPGFGALGTAWGDAQIAVPVIRNDAKDADAQLKNIAGQVAMATLSRLKSLSATGATGFGALSNQELQLIQNSIATLQSDRISNAELARSLKIIRDGMEKVANWQPTQQGGGVARPTTDAEYNALPSGALFIDPDDGKQYRKP